MVVCVSFVLVSKKGWQQEPLTGMEDKTLSLPSILMLVHWPLLLFILANGTWQLGCLSDWLDKSGKTNQRQHKRCKTHLEGGLYHPISRGEFGIRGEGGWMPASTSSHEAEPFVLNSSRYYDILSNLWTKVIEPVSHRWEPPNLLAKRQTTSPNLKQNKNQRRILSFP